MGSLEFGLMIAFNERPSDDHQFRGQMKIMPERFLYTATQMSAHFGCSNAPDRDLRSEIKLESPHGAKRTSTFVLLLWRRNCELCSGKSVRSHFACNASPST